MPLAAGTVLARAGCGTLVGVAARSGPRSVSLAGRSRRSLKGHLQLLGRTLPGNCCRHVVMSAAAGWPEDINIVNEVVLNDGSKLFQFGPVKAASSDANNNGGASTSQPDTSSSSSKSRAGSSYTKRSPVPKPTAKTTPRKAPKAEPTDPENSTESDLRVPPTVPRPSSTYAKRSPVSKSARQPARTHPEVDHSRGSGSARGGTRPADKSSGLKRLPSSFNKRSVVTKRSQPLQGSTPVGEEPARSSNGAAARPLTQFKKRSPIPLRKGVRSVPGVVSAKGLSASTPVEEAPSSAWPLVVPPRLPSNYVKRSPIKQLSMRVTAPARAKASVEERSLTEDEDDEVAETCQAGSTSLACMKVAELRTLAKEKGLKGYSKLKKAELIDALASWPL